jgi:hypothetical protein
MGKKQKQPEPVIPTITNEELLLEINKEKPIFPLGNNEVELPIGVVKLRPTKLKYFKDGTYNNFMVISNIGVYELLRYADGEKIIKDFLGAALDILPDKITFLEDLTPFMVKDIITKLNEINEIKESDFFAKLAEAEVISQELKAVTEKQELASDVEVL